MLQIDMPLIAGGENGWITSGQLIRRQLLFKKDLYETTPFIT